MRMDKKINKKALYPMVIGMSILLPLGSLIPLSIMAWNYYRSRKADDVDYSSDV